MQNINNFYKFVSEDETMANFQRKYGIHNTSALAHNRRHRKHALTLPSVGGIIDEPIEIEPAYTTLMTRNYCGNYIYSNGTLERIFTDNGYIQDDEYYFYIKDYQGNIRVVLNQANVPVELNSYYPYGALMAATATEGTQPYKYSAKELDRENGIDLYDFHARQMDPLVGRFTSMDKKSEKFYSISPYTYCAANPIAFVDPTGMAHFWHNGQDIGNDGINDDKIFVILTTEKVFKSTKEDVLGAGLSKKALNETLKFIKNNSGNSQAFADNRIAYNHSIEIESSAEIRQKMVDIVSADNGQGGDCDKNNREYGGYIENGCAIAVSCGDVSSNSEKEQANITLLCGFSTFHSHPSGTIQTEIYVGSTKRVVQQPIYTQHTSNADLYNSGKYIHYVFGRYNNKVYVYNSTGIQAVIPFDKFVTPKIK